MKNLVYKKRKELNIEEHVNFNVAKYAKNLALEIGLNNKTQERVYAGALFHDVGKVLIPRNILNKNSPLNNTEWEIMKKHSFAGYYILQNTLLNNIRDIALFHHEKWNGTGYPIGLKKDEIPIESRIVSICDVFEALIAKRVYKEAWSLDRTVAYIVNEKGRGFEPDLVDVFINKVI